MMEIIVKITYEHPDEKNYFLSSLSIKHALEKDLDNTEFKIKKVEEEE